MSLVVVSLAKSLSRWLDFLCRSSFYHLFEPGLEFALLLFIFRGSLWGFLIGEHVVLLDVRISDLVHLDVEKVLQFPVIACDVSFIVCFQYNAREELIESWVEV